MQPATAASLCSDVLDSFSYLSDCSITSSLVRSDCYIELTRTVTAVATKNNACLVQLLLAIFSYCLTSRSPPLSSVDWCWQTIICQDVNWTAHESQ